MEGASPLGYQVDDGNATPCAFSRFIGDVTTGMSVESQRFEALKVGKDVSGGCHFMLTEGKSHGSADGVGRKLGGG